MDMIMWTKVLVEVYPKLKDRIRKSEACIDAFVHSCFGSKRNAEYELNKLFDLIKAKNSLIYLKKAMEKAIENIGASNLRVIRLRFIDNIQFKDIALIMKINIRNVFRKLDREIWLLKEELLDMGIDEYECESVWGNEPLVNSVIKKVVSNKISYNKNHFVKTMEIAKDTIA